jgi:hypothetical protein
VLFKDKTMFVSNVGDSRAILVSDGGDGLKISPLSSDHTPFRKDERYIYHMNMYTYMDIYISHEYLFIFLCIYIYTFMYKYTYIYTYIYMHI